MGYKFIEKPVGAVRSSLAISSEDVAMVLGHQMNRIHSLLPVYLSEPIHWFRERSSTKGSRLAFQPAQFVIKKPGLLGPIYDARSEGSAVQCRVRR